MKCLAKYEMSFFRILFILLLSFLTLVLSLNVEGEEEIKKPKILIHLTTFGYSHFNFDCTVARWLTEAGYEVVSRAHS